MPRLRIAVTLVLTLCCVNVAYSQDEPAFPTVDEIKLLLTQTDRAMKSYKPLIDQEEKWLGKTGADAIAKDRQVVHALEIALEALQKRPDGFNSALGFAFFEWLDDASRNALLCASTSLSQATTLMMAGETNKASGLANLAQSCMDAANLIYTVSENAGALYDRYVRREQKLAEDSFSVAQKCTDALKKATPANKH